MSVLDEILAAKRDEVTVLHQPATREVLRRAALDAPPPRDFAARIHARARGDGRVAVIAEIKRRSPSKGDLAPDLDAADTAAAYETRRRGLPVRPDGPSVLRGLGCGPAAAREAASSTPVLRKDFTDRHRSGRTRHVGWAPTPSC